VTEQTLLFISGGTGILSFLAIFAMLASRKKPVYKKKGQLLLLNEQRFLTALFQALPADTILSFKVRLLDIVTASNATTGKSLEAELADYCVDFVLLDRATTAVRLCIEMDTESHSAAERLNKNTMISRALRRAGIPHLRLPLVRYYDPIRLRQILREAIASNTSA
jgi:hypothetical protein